MMKRGMLVDPDHMSVKARKQALDYVDARDYQGVVSSHSWSDDPSYERIYGMGGFVAAMKSDANGYLEKWKEHKGFWRASGSKRPFALGFADDMNGFSGQPGPRSDAAENPLPYPFTSPDRRRHPDRPADQRRARLRPEQGRHRPLRPLRRLGRRPQARRRRRIIEDMAGATDAYLETWERAVGVPDRACLKRRGPITATGYRKVRMKLNPINLLRRAGQPQERPERSYRYCVQGKENKKAELVAVFSDAAKPRVGLIASDARTHRISGVRPGSRASRI